eukprot:m.957647 g.957647  ORF g.957647 m.957647 type:complete len:61 (+) comp23876_c0_seq38:2765-2947(+)
MSPCVLGVVLYRSAAVAISLHSMTRDSHVLIYPSMVMRRPEITRVMATLCSRTVLDYECD